MKPGSKVDDYLSRTNRVDINPVGVQQEYAKIQIRNQERMETTAPVNVAWKPPTPEELRQEQREMRVYDAHNRNWEDRRGSATFRAGDSVIKE